MSCQDTVPSLRPEKREQADFIMVYPAELQHLTVSVLAPTCTLNRSDYTADIGFGEPEKGSVSDYDAEYGGEQFYRITKPGPLSVQSQT